MDRTTFRIAFAALAVGFVVVLAGCMDASLSQGGNAPATISIQDAPSAVPEVGISITGGGVNIAETVGPGTDALVFELPVGRQHEVSIDTTNFIGRRSFTLPAGGAQIDVQMLEKLFIPDSQNFRVVKVDDMSGAGWTTSQIMIDTVNDVAVGPDGYIYFAGNFTQFESFGVFSFANVDDLEFVHQPVDDFGVQGIAIDHEDGLLYYAGNNDGPFLRVVTLQGEAVADLTGLIADFLDVWGLAVDGNGNAYVSGLIYDFDLGDNDPYPAVMKIDPNSSSSIGRPVRLGVSDWNNNFRIDVVYNDATGRIYATNPDGAPGEKIVAIDTNGAVVDSFGSFPADPEAPEKGEFYAPRRFVAVNRSKLYVLDDGDNASLSSDNRVVSFGPNLDGSQWETYGSYGSGQDRFEFYVQY